MRTIAGTLTKPNGSVFTGASLVFRPVPRLTAAGVPDVPVAETVSALDANGNYDVDVLPGRYRVWVRWGDHERQLGEAVIVDGPPITLPEAIAADDVEPTVIGDLIDRVVALEDAGTGTGLPALAAGPADEIVQTNAAGSTLARSGQTVASLLAAARDRATHTGTQLAATIGDSTPLGRALMTATDDAAARNAIGAESTANKGAAGGYASLDGSGQIPAAQIPSIALTEYLGTAASEAAMLALTGQRGDWCARTDTGTVWVITGADSTVIIGWTQFVYPAAPVSSVAGRTGAITLSAADISGLGEFRRGRATLDLGLFPHRYWEQTVSAPGVTAGMTAVASLAPHADTDVNSCELLHISALSAEALTGEVRISIAFAVPARRIIYINWSAS